MIPLYVLLTSLENDDERSKLLYIYEHYRFLMYRIAYDIIGSQQDTEDVVQDAFLAILKHIKSISDDPAEGKRVRNWACLITRNLAINFANRAKRHPENEMEIEAAEVLALEHPQKIEDVMNIVDLGNLIDTLPSNHKDILYLVVLYDHDFKTISDIMKVSEKTARKRFDRAREALRRLLGEKGNIIDEL